MKKLFQHNIGNLRGNLGLNDLKTDQEHLIFYIQMMIVLCFYL